MSYQQIMPYFAIFCYAPFWFDDFFKVVKLMATHMRSYISCLMWCKFFVAVKFWLKLSGYVYRFQCFGKNNVSKLHRTSLLHCALQKHTTDAPLRFKNAPQPFINRVMIKMPRYRSHPLPLLVGYNSLWVKQ